MDDKIKLRDVKVIFANIKDEGFGRSITIDATDKDVQKKISDWVKENKIGKDTPGEAKFKEYKPEEGDPVIQYSFKLNDYTKIIGLNNLTADDLGYGAEVSLFAQAFDYDNKFGKGTSASLTAVLITKAVRTSADDDIEELMAEAGVNPEDIESDKSGYEAAKATAESLRSAADKAKDEKTENIDTEINLDDVPF